MILALESSCDETALAVVDLHGEIALNVCLTQTHLHERYGGVVPELASRWHFDVLDELTKSITTALTERKIAVAEIQGVAATMGPGLVGPLLVGSSFARGLAAGWQCPFFGVHHLRAHVASALLDPALGTGNLAEKCQKLFPAWVLLVSGGHCLLLEVQPDLRCQILRSSSDDAAGECFDKCAKLMGLPYPGGPAVQSLAATCTSADFALAEEWANKLPKPRSLAGFSFAGLKTAFRLLFEQDPRAPRHLPALSRALEQCIVQTLVRVIDREYAEQGAPARFICCGGVAANLHLRAELTKWADRCGCEFYCAPFAYATDNAVMVAVAALVQAPQLNESTIFARGRLSE